MGVVREIAPCLVADEKNIFLYLEPAKFQIEDFERIFSGDAEELFFNLNEYQIEYRVLRLSVTDFISETC